MAEAPYNVYPTADGYIAIICVGDVQWRNLCLAMGRADLGDAPHLDSLKKRVEAMDEVDAIVGAWTAAHTKEAAFDTLMAHKVPCAPVRTLAEVMTDPNMHARGALQYQDHPTLGRIVVQHSPLRFDGVTPRALTPSRELGADTDAVLAERPAPLSAKR
jgi:formyl-CoA transferase